MNSNDISINTKIISLKDFLQVLSPELGSGGEGSCYLYRGKVIKVLNGPDYCKEVPISSIFSLNDEFNDLLEVDESLIPSEEYIMRYANIKNDAFAFANGIFRVDNRIRGVVMPYIDIPQLSKFNLSNTKYDSLIKACRKCSKDLKEISQLGIEIFDIADTNIHFDGRQFKFCDTLNWHDHNIDSFDEVWKKNKLSISSFLIEYFTKGNIRRSLKLNRNMIQMYRDRGNIEDPAIYFSELKEHLSNICDEPINSAGKANKILSKKIFKSS